MKIIKKIIAALLIAAFVCGMAVIAINHLVLAEATPYILPADAAGEGYDCILVLGCGVHGTTPSHMLEDRLLQGIELYHSGASEKMIMSGDHGRDHYDEVNVMKDFAIDRDVASSDIFMDHAGFSTYESMYRAKEIFQAEKILIVTQKYHLYRAVYNARALGLDAYGVASDPRTYVGRVYREIREILARNKDFIYSVIKPEPTCLGEVIPVSGNGDVTNDR
mgnify:CR=1 FL=1